MEETDQSDLSSQDDRYEQNKKIAKQKIKNGKQQLTELFGPVNTSAIGGGSVNGSRAGGVNQGGDRKKRNKKRNKKNKKKNHGDSNQSSEKITQSHQSRHHQYRTGHGESSINNSRLNFSQRQSVRPEKKQEYDPMDEEDDEFSDFDDVGEEERKAFGYANTKQAKTAKDKAVEKDKEANDKAANQINFGQAQYNFSSPKVNALEAGKRKKPTINVRDELEQRQSESSKKQE